MLFLRSLWKSKYYLLVATAVIFVASSIWKPQYILVTPGSSGFFATSEQLVPFIALLPISFLLYDNYEIELGLINGVSTVKMVLCKYFPTILSTLIPLGAAILLVQKRKFYAAPESIFIPLEVPENYKLYLLISGAVTILFFSALLLFFRVALRNCYAPVGIGILIFSLFEARTTSINSLSVPLKNALFDPFITRYLIGDKLVNEGFLSTATEQFIDPIPHLWTYNRLLFLGLAVVLLVITCLLLKREKLHESFGD